MFKKILFILLGAVVAAIAGFFIIGLVKPKYEGTVSIVVNAPASKTFAVFNDTANMRKWQPTFIKMENISGAANEPGSKWRLFYDEHGRELVMTETVTAFEQDKLFAFTLEDEFANFQIEIRFEENNGQTTITQTDRGEGNSLSAKSMIALMGGSIRKHQLEMYTRLKELVEKS